MGFGIFKKIKDAFKKAKNWLQRALPTARKVIEQAKPLIPALIPENKRKKVEDVINIIDSGTEAADDYLNRNDSKKAINWINYEIKPRLKY